MLTKADLAAWVALQAQMVYQDEDEDSPAWEQTAWLFIHADDVEDEA